jgi:hypothetical protein
MWNEEETRFAEAIKVLKEWEIRVKAELFDIIELPKQNANEKEICEKIFRLNKLRKDILNCSRILTHYGDVGLNVLIEASKDVSSKNAVRVVK